MLSRIGAHLGWRATGSGDAALDRILGDLVAGDIAIDCGANVGSATALMARHGAEVHAFEPNPFAFRRLQERFAASPNVKCYPLAAGASDGTAALYLHDRSDEDQVYWSTGSSLDPRKRNIDRARKIDVETIDLGRFLRELGKPVRLMKVDIEGAELFVLPPLIESGALDEIECVLIELHDDKNPELKPETEQLRQLVAARGLGNVRFDWV